MSDKKPEQPVDTEQPKKGMTAGNVILLIFGIILILGGSFYLYKFFTRHANNSVPAATTGSSNLARGVLDAAGTAQDIDIMRGFSYYF